MRLHFAALAASSLLLPCAAAAASPASEELARPAATAGFVLAAPDRGFQGNEELRDVLAEFAATRPARLVFVTSEGTEERLVRAAEELRAAGAGEIVVLPLFAAASDPRLVALRELAGDLPAPRVAFARPYGASYFAVEALAERLRGVSDSAGRRLVVIGAGAATGSDLAAMTGETRRLAAWAAEGLGFASVAAVVAPDPWRQLPELEASFRRDLEAALGDPATAVVAPFHLGPKLDGMMRFDASLRRWLPDGTAVVPGDVTPHPSIGLWMEREARRRLPAGPGQVGVVVLAHGGDLAWNESVLTGIAPLAERLPVEACFSMADRGLMERALRRLEERGVTRVAVVRAFALEASFRSAVERMLGLDIEEPGDSLAEPPGATDHAGHAAGAGHGHGGGASPRILTAAVTVTTGGLEDHPLFARALLERALALSTDPEKETVVLAAHGAGEDAENDRWRAILASLARQMRDAGAAFRSIESVTWREDWPDKRDAEIAAARRIVEEAARQGDRVLVIPARLAGRGPEEKYLSGLSYELGAGFAPHPLFARWLEEAVASGTALLQEEAATAPLERVVSRTD